MADNKNMELNDEMMAKATGGNFSLDGDYATITGIVMVDPYPDDSIYENVWAECQSGGYQVYEVSDGRIAIASPEIPVSGVGDTVVLNAIRGFYGWEIVGVVDF